MTLRFKAHKNSETYQKIKELDQKIDNQIVELKRICKSIREDCSGYYLETTFSFLIPRVLFCFEEGPIPKGFLFEQHFDGKTLYKLDKRTRFGKELQNKLDNQVERIPKTSLISILLDPTLIKPFNYSTPGYAFRGDYALIITPDGWDQLYDYFPEDLTEITHKEYERLNTQEVNHDQ